MHIISAALLLVSMGYSYHLWKNIQQPQKIGIFFQRIQTQTWLIITPVAILQLGTGFTMISLQHENLSQFWISGSMIGFITLIGSWFSFMYFLLLSQQLPQSQNPVPLFTPKYKFFRHIQSLMLSICAVSLLSMMFLMANKMA